MSTAGSKKPASPSSPPQLLHHQTHPIPTGESQSTDDTTRNFHSLQAQSLASLYLSPDHHILPGPMFLYDLSIGVAVVVYRQFLMHLNQRSPHTMQFIVSNVSTHPPASCTPSTRSCLRHHRTYRQHDHRKSLELIHGRQQISLRLSRPFHTHTKSPSLQTVEARARTQPPHHLTQAPTSPA